ncbi:PREDICTED: uncharacterized protein C7orf50 homolog [Dinoponera quadriceps]|uniref:Uncharacterized protein C7orf50 homolog n=1 Tax=Dinoponera quadriceps TaxID=609295 RepID=A0A6P3WWB1_DINQU|nr:PREDICTED: uncharacterized protein C7orf50 homolog [Dinoponera quadriceps]XP_014469944.1 PREDICTED: uncharacterized protein C7orf50 homolog [Dinoponera quadriceps]XP_014469945.1 PREDICTED: uncharacterized protein C7orf50 homolog [Dinoponera quadriceps]
MDAENTTKIKLRQPRKRKSEKQKTDDADINNYCKKNKTFQESIVQQKQTRRKKTKFIAQEIGDSEKLMKVKVSDATINEDILKEDIDENIKISKKPSKRELKKEKALQREAQKRHVSRIIAMQRALNYVSKWKHSRSEWKFEKIRQIWLIDNLLDENSIPDTIFPVVLEYFEGCKGMAREVLLRKGMDVIRKAEDEDEENKNGIMESIAYKRARQLLQALPTDR